MDHKTYIVTGASGGIGLEITKLLLKNNNKVIGTYYKNKSKISTLKEKNFLPLELNLENVENIESFVGNLKNINLDGLVNNSGMNIPGSFDKINIENWNKVNNVNILGPFLLSQKLEPFFKHGGSIVNLGSFSGQLGGPISTHYTVAKSGIIGLTQNMAIYFSKKNIRVNCISPGLIDTQMAQNAENHPFYDRILLSRVGKPSEIASVVNFLLSDSSSYITGQTVNVNGGMTF